MIKEIKSIPLADLLSSLGHTPAVTKGSRLWYRSPLRQERTPSFKVETDRNIWFDFGLGRGGDIIDLAKLLFQSENIGYISDCMAKSVAAPSERTVASSFPPRPSAPTFRDMETVPLEHPALIAYLKERGIPAHIAKARCMEARYSFGGRRYFAVAFPNVSGGMELRNRYFKGCSGHKNISAIPFSRDGPAERCAVFEGFIDYLSALVLEMIPGCDVVVLNSVSNINRAIPVLSVYRHIDCYLDNDVAGKTALSQLTAQFGSTANDRSSLYVGFNDLNDYLVATDITASDRGTMRVRE